jgi:predicted heme/steroid binding protein
MVYGTELRPECPSDVSNVLVADNNYCNIFYHCQSGRGSVYMCRDGTVFDSSDSESVSSCRSEELVQCGTRLILTSQGTRASKSSNQKLPLGKSLQAKYSNFILLPPIQNQKEVINVVFDCKGRLDGHWRDGRYCDIFHACLAGEQKRSYGCNQVGERFYFDDATQK